MVKLQHQVQFYIMRSNFLITNISYIATRNLPYFFSSHILRVTILQFISSTDVKPSFHYKPCRVELYIIFNYIIGNVLQTFRYIRHIK